MPAADLDDLVRIAEIRARQARTAVAAAEADVEEIGRRLADAQLDLAARTGRARRRRGMEMAGLLQGPTDAVRVARIGAAFQADADEERRLVAAVADLVTERAGAEGRLKTLRAALVEADRHLTKLTEAGTRLARRNRHRTALAAERAEEA